MNPLEFTTKIERGVIHLPKEYEEYDNSVAHVVITVETPENKSSKKENLLAVLKKIQKTSVFQDIENPLDWQKNIRNEWE
jgi:hypothetical protein